MGRHRKVPTTYYSKLQDKKKRYDQKIKDAIDSGLTIEEIHENLDKNLGVATQEAYDIQERLRDLRDMKDAIFRFLNPEPVFIAPLVEDDRERKTFNFMTARELKIMMAEKKITSKELAKVTKRTPDAIVKYRKGGVSIPRDVAIVVKGWTGSE